VNVGMLSSLLD